MPAAEVEIKPWLYDIEFTSSSGLLSAYGGYFLILAVLSSYIFALLSKGRLALLMPKLKQITSKLLIDKEIPVMYEAAFLYLVQLLVYGLLAATVTFLILMVVEVEGLTTFNVVIILQVMSLVWAIVLQIFISVECRWVSLHYLQSLLSAYIAVDVLCFLLLQLFGQRTLEDTGAQVQLSYRASGILWVTLSLGPLPLLNVYKPEFGTQKRRSSIIKNQRADFLHVKPMSEKSILQLFCGCFLEQPEQATSASRVPAGGESIAGDLTNNAAGSVAFGNEANETAANSRGDPDCCYIGEQAKGVVQRFLTLWFRIAQGFSEDRYEELGWWVMSLVPLFMFSMIYIHRDVVESEAHGAALLALCICVLNEICASFLRISGPTLFSLVIFQRYMIILSGDTYWLFGSASILLLTSSILVMQITNQHFPNPDSKASALINAMHQMTKKGRNVQSELKEAIDSARKAEYVAVALEQVNAGGDMRAAEMAAEKDFDNILAAKVDPQQISGVQCDNLAVAKKESGSGTATDKDEEDNEDGASSFSSQVKALLTLQVTLVTVVIIGNFEPWGLRLEPVYRSPQLAWVGFAWCFWFFAVLAALVRHTLYSGGFGNIKALLQDHLKGFEFDMSGDGNMHVTTANPQEDDEENTTSALRGYQDSVAEAAAAAASSQKLVAKSSASDVAASTWTEKISLVFKFIFVSLADILKPNLQGSVYVGFLVFTAWISLVGSLCWAAYLTDLWELVPLLSILPYSFFNLYRFLTEWEMQGCPLPTWFVCLANWEIKDCSLPALPCCRRNTKDENIPTANPQTESAVKAVSTSDYSNVATDDNNNYTGSATSYFSSFLCSLCKPNTFPHASVTFLIAFAICIPLEHFTITVDVALWLITFSLFAVVLAYWRATLLVDRNLTYLVILSWVPTVVWAAENGTNTHVLQSMPWTLTTLLLLTATSIQLFVLTLWIWDDCYKRYLSGIARTPYAQSDSDVETASMQICNCCGICKLEVLLPGIYNCCGMCKVEVFSFEKACFGTPFPIRLIFFSLSFSWLMAFAVITFIGIEYSAIISIGMAIAGTMCMIYMYSKLELFRIVKGSTTRTFEKRLSWIKKLITSIPILFCLGCGIYGALISTDHSFWWLSVSWVSIAGLLFLYGLWCIWKGSQYVYNVHYFPVYIEDVNKNGVKDCSIEASCIPFSAFLIGIWAIWGSVIVTPAEYGVILYVLCFSSAALYMKFMCDDAWLSRLADEVDQEMLTRSAKEALDTLYGEGWAQIAQDLISNSNDETAFGQIGTAESAEVNALAKQETENSKYIALLIKQRDDAVRNMNNSVKATCVDAIGAVPFFNIILGRKAGNFDQNEWRDIDDNCDKVMAEHYNCVNVASKLNDLVALAKLKALSFAANSLRVKESRLVEFLRATEPSMVSITIDELRHLPFSLVSNLMGSFVVYNTIRSQYEKQQKLRAAAEDRIAKSKERARLHQQEVSRKGLAEIIRERNRKKKEEEAALKAAEAEKERQRLLEEARKAAEEAAKAEKERQRLQEEARKAAEEAAKAEKARKAAVVEKERKRLQEEARKAAAAAAAAEEARKAAEKEEERKRLQEEARKAAAAEEARKAAEEKERKRAYGGNGSAVSVMTTFGTIVSEDVNEVISDLRSHKGLYTDEDFKGTDNVLGEGESHLTSATAGWGDGYDLLRLSCKDPKLHEAIDYSTCTDRVKGPSANDVSQGSLGDCYLLSAVSTIAEKPKIIDSIIVHADPKKGIYVLKLWFNGAFRCIVLDDYVPYIVPSWPKGDTRQTLAFQKYNGPESLWVILIEKAYAKLHGSYEQIVGGFSDVALADLTGGIPHRISNFADDLDKSWHTLHKMHMSGYLLGAGSLSGKDTQHTDSGIVKGHAYSILDVRELASGDRLLKMRNPWGKFEWKGRWSDGSAEWTPRYRKILNHDTSADDGTFWIPFEDFASNFRNIYSCHLVGNQHMEEISGEWTRSDNSAAGCQWNDSYNNPQFLVTVTHACEVTVVSSLAYEMDPSTGTFKDDGREAASGIAVYKPRILKGAGENRTRKCNQRLSHSDQIAESSYSYLRDSTITFTLYGGGEAVLVPAMFRKGIENKFIIRVYTSDGKSSLKRLT